MTAATARIPHFIIGGAPRAGTTWLVEALDRHPDVYMAKPVVPEPKFFHIDSLYEKGMAYYLERWFAQMPAHCLAGEKDTYYLENPDCPGRIQRHLPNVKLIFILREPGERAYSNYLWSRQHGHEPLSFEEALDKEEERERTLSEHLRFVRPHAYFSRSLYAVQLERYYALFPRENILCLNLNLLARSPEDFLLRVHAFLGLAPRPADAAGLGNVNKGAGEGEERMSPRTRERLERAFAEPNRRLYALIGADFEPW